MTPLSPFWAWVPQGPNAARRERRKARTLLGASAARPEYPSTGCPQHARCASGCHKARIFWPCGPRGSYRALTRRAASPHIARAKFPAWAQWSGDARPLGIGAPGRDRAQPAKVGAATDGRGGVGAVRGLGVGAATGRRSNGAGAAAWVRSGGRGGVGAVRGLGVGAATGRRSNGAGARSGAGTVGRVRVGTAAGGHGRAGAGGHGNGAGTLGGGAGWVTWGW